MDDSTFAELWLDTHADGGNIDTMVAHYRKSVPECTATKQSLKTALSTRATKIRAGFIALGKTPEEASALFPKFARTTKTAERLISTLTLIMERAAKASAATAAVDAAADMADEAAE